MRKFYITIFELLCILFGTALFFTIILLELRFFWLGSMHKFRLFGRSLNTFARVSNKAFTGETVIKDKTKSCSFCKLFLGFTISDSLNEKWNSTE